MQALEAPTTHSLLTEEEISAFNRDGYLVLDPEIPDEVLDGILSDLQGKYTDPYRVVDGVVYSSGRIQDAWKMSANAKAVALAPKVLAVLEQLYGRKPLPFQTLNFFKGTEQMTHSDTVHFNSEPATYMCGVWVALEDMDMDVGPLMYYAGSHLLPEVTIDDTGLRATLMSTWYYTRITSSRYYASLIRALGRVGLAKQSPWERTEDRIYGYCYEPFIAEMVKRHNLKPHYATIKKGQAFIWSSNLLHGGSPQRDKTRSRHSQVTHYYFEGCRYYTPLLQTRDRRFRKVTHWRNPEWIS